MAPLYFNQLLSFIFLVSLSPADCQGLSRAMCGQHQGPFLRRCRDRLMGRVNPPSCHTATAEPRHKIQLNFVKALSFLSEERGFETFDGGNKGLGGGWDKPGKKWNACLSCHPLPPVAQQYWGWVGLSAKRRAGNAMYTLFLCLLRSKETLFVSHF